MKKFLLIALLTALIPFPDAALGKGEKETGLDDDKCTFCVRSFNGDQCFEVALPCTPEHSVCDTCIDHIIIGVLNKHTYSKEKKLEPDLPLCPFCKKEYSISELEEFQKAAKIKAKIKEALNEHSTTLSLIKCELTHLPPNIAQLPNLKELLLSINPNIQLSDIQQCKKIEKLDIGRCALKTVDTNIHSLADLKELELFCNPGIDLNGIHNCTKLEKLNVLQCSSKQFLKIFKNLKILKNLALS